MASRLRVNVLANAVGRLSSMGLAILCTPLYIHFLGITAYGLIGFYITLQASLSFLEMGLSRACNRELARLSGQGEDARQSMLNMLRSLEVIYWLVAALIGFALTSASGWIASSWLNSASISTADLEKLIVLMAWVIALRWPAGLYSGALMGLQQQVLMNIVLIAVSLLNWVGSTLVIWLVSSNVLIFFQWQLFVSLCHTAIFAVITWKSMPRSSIGARFSLSVVKKIIPFVAGVGGNEILGTILIQADKLILSALLPLKQFGYYALATMIANIVSMVAGPISNAVFPRLSQKIGAGIPESQISTLYHRASQAVAVLIIPAALVIALFAKKALYVYTGSIDIASNTEKILMILAIAKMLHASMIVPYSLQLAYGWVKLSLYINIVSVLWLVPAIYWLAGIYGPSGAAIAWLVVTIGYVIIGIPLMHRRLLIGEWGRWMWRAMVAPLASVGAFLLIIRWLLLDVFPSGRWSQGILLLGIGASALMLAVFSAHDVRKWFLGYAIKWRKS